MAEAKPHSSADDFLSVRKAVAPGARVDARNAAMLSLARIEEQLEAAEREIGHLRGKVAVRDALVEELRKERDADRGQRDAMSDAIAAYADATGTLIYSSTSTSDEERGETMHVDPFKGYTRRSDGSIYPPDYDFGATPQAAQSSMPDPNGLVEHGRIGGVPLPLRVVIGANGAYWRDFGSAYSMAVVSSDNDPVEEIAVYVPQIYEDRLRAERDAVTEALLLHKERLAQLVELTDFLRDVTWHEDVQGSAALSPDDFERLRTLVADAYPATRPDA